jgi:hypothetical protein
LGQGNREAAATFRRLSPGSSGHLQRKLEVSGNKAMDNYVVRIYRRAGRKSRVLIGTIEVAGTEKKMVFSNIEELWEILRRRKGWDLCAPPSPRRHLRKEVMRATGGSRLVESGE